MKVQVVSVCIMYNIIIIRLKVSTYYVQLNTYFVKLCLFLKCTYINEQLFQLYIYSVEHLNCIKIVI